jgi:hypothetical protein
MVLQAYINGPPPTTPHLAHNHANPDTLVVSVVIALISSVAVIISSLISRRGATEAARITAGDQVRFDAVFIQALADLEVAVQQHDAAIEVARIQAAAASRSPAWASHGRLRGSN